MNNTIEHIEQAKKLLESFYSMHDAGEPYVQAAIAAALIDIAESLGMLVLIAQYTEANEKRLTEERAALAAEYDAITDEEEF